MNMESLPDGVLLVAAYGPTGDAKAGQDEFRSWHGWVGEVFEKLGLVTTHMAGDFYQPEITRLTSDKPYSSRSFRSRLLDESERRNLKLLAHYSMGKDRDGLLSFDWSAYARLQFDPDDGATAVFGVGVADGATMGPCSGRSFADDAMVALVNRVSASYGFATLMPRSFFPAGYAFGIGGGGAPRELRLDANSWSRSARRESSFRIRNVFGVNILNDKHLSIETGDTELGQWISASRNRGELRAMESGQWRWGFDTGDGGNQHLEWDFPLVKKARSELAAFGIFPWQADGR